MFFHLGLLLVQNSFGEDSFAWRNSEGMIQIETRYLPDSAGCIIHK